MATKRIKDITGSTTTPAPDDYVALDGVTNGTRKITADNLLIAAGSTYLEESNNLSDVASAATSRTNLDVYSTTEVNDRTNARQPANGVDYSGSASFSTIGDSDLLSFTDGSSDSPFTISAIVDADDLTSFPVITKYGSSGGGNREWLFGFSSSDKLQLLLVDSGDDITSRIADVAETRTGEKLHVAAVFTAASAVGAAADDVTLYVDGVEVGSTATNNPSYGGMSNTAQAAKLMMASSGTYGDGKLHSVLVFNRALSADQVALLAANGNTPELADQWGESAVWTADFTGDSVDGVTANVGSVSATATVGADTDNIQFTCASGSSGSRFLQKASLFTAGQRYRLSGFEYYIPSGQSNVDGIRFTANAQIISQLDSPTLGSWQTLPDVEFVAEGTGDLRIRPQDGGSLIFDDAGGDDTFAIRAGTVTPIGAVAAYFPENIESDGSIIDASSNELNANATNVTPLRTKPQVSGSWSPVLEFGGASTGIVYDTNGQQGYWRKLDEKTVHVECIILLTNKGSATGNARISGFPFTVRNSSGTLNMGVAGIICSNMTGLTGVPVSDIRSNTTTVNVNQTSATGVTAITNANFTATSIVQLSAVYSID